MKLTRLFTSLFAITLCLAVLASASFAATKNHLNNPLGLAVDASSNLYIANHGANQILVYNSGYAQQTAKTITTGIAEPTGLAIDPYGNLWVANYSSGSITEYTAGVQQWPTPSPAGYQARRTWPLMASATFGSITMRAT